MLEINYLYFSFIAVHAQQRYKKLARGMYKEYKS